MAAVPAIAGATDFAEAPRFPRGAIALSVAAILLVASAGIIVNWLVGERIKAITSSQIEVLSSAQEVRFLTGQKDAAMQLALATGDTVYIEQGAKLQVRLQDELYALEDAIVLDGNRRSFGEADKAERELRAPERRLALLVSTGRLNEARAIFEGKTLRALRSSLLQDVDDIEKRSKRYVAASREDADRMLTHGLAASGLAILLIIGALVLMLRPTRQWGKQLQAMHREAQVAAQAKADFLATMSHEIRTPLNGVIGFADILLDDPALSANQRRQVSLIQSAGSMLLTIVNDILDLSRIEAGQVELEQEPFAIASLVDECISIIRPAVAGKDLELTHELEPGLSDFYLGDAGRLRQILLNLLNNAAKFTEQGNIEVCVSCSPVSDNEDRVVLMVHDTGIGIAPDRISALFEPFIQADTSIAKKFGGTGLGLSICSDLLDLMGGSIAVQSTPGEGTTFTVSVDLPKCAELRSSDRSEGSFSKIASILVVEDLPMNREIAQAILERAGHHVVLAASGAQAIQAISRQQFDLVLMDIQMPGMDGIAASRAIRRLPAPHGTMPILAMTANTLPEQVRSYREAGMDGHIAKPLKAQLLEAAIAGALGIGGNVRGAQTLAEGHTPAFDADCFAKVAAVIPPDRLDGHARTLAKLCRDTAALAHDSPLIAQQAHKIASQAGTLGLERLHNAARALEIACESGEGRNAPISRFAEAAGDVEIHLLPALEAAGRNDIAA